VERALNVEVIVVGAGMAGLAAAADLVQAGVACAVFEARDRIGGRALTVHDLRVPVPIELGAEFVHGEAPITARLLNDARLAAVDIAGGHLQADGGPVRPADFWKQIQRVLQRLDRKGADRSFLDVLERGRGRTLSARDKAAALEFVQGFHAADPAVISAHAITPEPGEDPGETASRTGRVVAGYDHLAAWLARDLGSVLRLETAIERIAWQRGRVDVTVRTGTGKPERVSARAAIVTLPVGVIQTAFDAPPGVRFDPDPPTVRKAYRALASGSVVRLVFAFHEPPWSGAKKLKDPHALDHASFLHLRGAPFPVWWTAWPLRVPVLVAWCGGERAAALAGAPRDAIASAALESLADRLGVTARKMKSRLLAAWTHDWDSDPHARGAYSYARVGGKDAAETLARPVQGTLFFAGEATDTGGYTGTVEGALASGQRAAKQVLKALTQ